MRLDERGTHRPSYDTAKALAAWLGWTVEEVMVAAEMAVDALIGVAARFPRQAAMASR